MANKALEMTIEIGGRISGSLGNAFQRATGNIDDLRGRSRTAQRELNRLGNEFRQGRITQTQYAEATERITREMRQLENAQRRIKAFSGTLQNGLNTTKAVASVAAVTTAAVASAAAVKTLNVASDFEAQMSKVQSKSEATATEMIALRQTALDLGASTSLSASETAGAMDDLAAGGMNVNQIIKAMPGIIAGAEASGEDLSTVSTTTATALNIWGMEAEEASRVSDVLAMSANISAASVEDMSYAFKYAGKPAADLGLSMEEVSAATAIMTNSGLEGSNAGTSLRASLLALNNPAKTQQKIMSKLGFSIKDSGGKAKSLSGIVSDLAKATERMSDADRVATMQKLVGTEAVSGFLSLMSAGPDQIDEMTTALENSAGSAAKASAIMKDNYAGAKEEFFGAIESGQIAFATPILGVLKDTFQGLTGTIEDNMDAVGALGEKVASHLRDVLDPFAMTKPELTPAISMDPDAFSAYQKELAKFSMFEGMDFGDKIIYSLDTATEKMEDWLGGSGGEAMGEIFSKLGEIAFNAWLGAFTGALKATGSNIMEGNVGGAVGMGAAAWMMGGGLMVKGAIGAGKWGKEIFSSRRAATTTSTSAPSVGSSTTRTTSSSTQSPGTPAPTRTVGPAAMGAGTQLTLSPGTTAPIRTIGPATMSAGTPLTLSPGTTAPVRTVGQSSASTTTSRPLLASPPGAPAPPTPATPPARTVGSVGRSAISAVGKAASKAMLPLTLATEAFNVFKSEDKTKAASEAVGGLAAGAGGAKVGAAIGTAIAPGIGTAIGGLLGGAAGYIGGKWFGGKAVDTVRGDDSRATSTSTPAPIDNVVAAPAQTFDGTQLKTSATALATTLTNTNTSLTALNTQFTVTESTMSTSFTSLQTNTDLAANNMQILGNVTGQASGWIVGGLMGIQEAGQRVVTALNRLETRINNVQLQIPGSTPRRTQYE